jgi:hypothetical protein
MPADPRQSTEVANSDASETKGEWQAGDPCGMCGSTNTIDSVLHGAVCLTCGAQDDDD